MKSRLAAIALAGSALLGGVVVAQSVPGSYLSAATEPDTLAILPSAPAAGSPADVADRAIFKATRKLEGSPRWTLARNDVDSSPGAMMRDFSCAAGVVLDPASAPKLAAVLRRVGPDVVRAVNGPKDFYKRRRPYLVDSGDICVPKSESLARNYDYPSGHTTWGWTVGLILAELAPERTGPILARARAFGESRVVCGAHNASAVAAGRTTASALNAALVGDAGFRADLDAARVEMAALRSRPGPPPAACAAEASLIAKTPW
ncbi:MAG: phosphatase PAP2 family protein [Caulobacteraceae bacterium]